MYHWQDSHIQLSTVKFIAMGTFLSMTHFVYWLLAATKWLIFMATYQFVQHIHTPCIFQCSEFVLCGPIILL